MSEIISFSGEHRFLSNFHPAEIRGERLTYPSAEHAYQAAKCADEDCRVTFSHASLTAARAKTMGRGVTLRPDWEAVKLTVMLQILRLKFAPGTALSLQLLATDDNKLVEGNQWHDNYWGECTCQRCSIRPHENHLGRLLMQVRKELR